MRRKKHRVCDEGRVAIVAHDELPVKCGRGRRFGRTARDSSVARDVRVIGAAALSGVVGAVHSTTN